MEVRADLVFTCFNDPPFISEEPARSLLTAATSDVGKDIIKEGERSEKADIRELTVRWTESDTHLEADEMPSAQLRSDETTWRVTWAKW